MSTNALALSQWLPDTRTQTPNAGDVIQVLSVPIDREPVTQFAPAGSGGGGGTVLPTATKQGLVMMSGAGPTFSPVYADIDEGRY